MTYAERVRALYRSGGHRPDRRILDRMLSGESSGAIYGESVFDTKVLIQAVHLGFRLGTLPIRVQCFV